MSAQTTADWVVLGKVAGVLGLRGWIKLHSHTEPRINIVHYDPLFFAVAGHYQQLHLAEGKTHGKGVVAKIVGIDDRNKAEQLIGCAIAITREQLPALENDEYYWSDLQGLRVINQDDTPFGIVEQVFSTGANDVLVIKGDRERLVPFLRDDVIVAVDLALGEIRVNWDADF